MGIEVSKQATLAEDETTRPLNDENSIRTASEVRVAMKRPRSLSACLPTEHQPQKRLRSSDSCHDHASAIVTTRRNGPREDQSVDAVSLGVDSIRTSSASASLEFSRLGIPSTLSTYVERSHSKTDRVGRSSRNDSTQPFGKALLSDTLELSKPQHVTISPCNRDLVLAPAGLAQTIATIHAAASNDNTPPEGLEEAPEVHLTRIQQKMNTMLLQKAISTLHELDSEEIFRGKYLNQPIVLTQLEAPHHRMRDGRLPWQVTKKRSSDVLRVRSKKRPRQDDGDDMMGEGMRKRLRRSLKDDLEDEVDSAVLLRPGTRGRTRTLIGVWPRDGLHGVRRRGELARRW